MIDEPPQQQARNPEFPRLVLELKGDLTPMTRFIQTIPPAMRLIEGNLLVRKRLMAQRELQPKSRRRGLLLQQKRVSDFRCGVPQKFLIAITREYGIQRLGSHQDMEVQHCKPCHYLRKRERNHHVGCGSQKVVSTEGYTKSLASQRHGSQQRPLQKLQQHLSPLEFQNPLAHLHYLNRLSPNR